MLQGTKIACAEGGCGACAVEVSSYDAATGVAKHFAACCLVHMYSPCRAVDLNTVSVCCRQRRYPEHQLLPVSSGFPGWLLSHHFRRRWVLQERVQRDTRCRTPSLPCSQKSLWCFLNSSSQALDAHQCSQVDVHIAQQCSQERQPIVCCRSVCQFQCFPVWVLHAWVCGCHTSCTQQMPRARGGPNSRAPTERNGWQSV